jgi:predicted metal-dependent HD superfamily phosphohydrolase
MASFQTLEGGYLIQKKLYDHYVVSGLIRSTNYSAPNLRESEDEKLIHDIDLVCKLCGTESQRKKRSLAICAEFGCSGLNDPKWVKGRRDFLSRILEERLKRGNIFLADFFESFDSSARVNIEAELEELGAMAVK